MMLLADRRGRQRWPGALVWWFEPGALRLPLRNQGHVFPSSGSRCLPHSLFEKAHFTCDSAVRSRARDSYHSIIFPMFPFVPALFRLIPHFPVLENIFFFFFAEDRITHRDGKDHPAFHLLLTHHLSQTIPILFSFLLHEIVQHKFGHSWCFSSAPSGFASSSCSSTDLKHFKNNTFIYFWLCWVSVAA